MSICLPYHKEFELLPDGFRYRVQVLRAAGWEYLTEEVYNFAELRTLRDSMPTSTIRGVKISWANPWAIHSILWVMKAQ
jgi:hypothetical protein